MIDFQRFPHLSRVLDTEVEPATEPGAPSAAAMRERRQRWEEFLRDRGERYRGCRLSNFEVSCDDQRVAVRLLREYCEELPARVRAGQGIVLLGPVGSGKDHLVTAVVRAAILTYGINIAWRSGPGLQREFRDAIDAGGDGEGEIIRRLGEVGGLALSDPAGPGAALTVYQQSCLYAIVDHRYSHRRPTWVTLNSACGAEADATLGAAVVDRLRDGALVLPCLWQSHRRAAV